MLGKIIYKMIWLKKIGSYFKLIGIGGMGTRGFGRLEIIETQKGDNNDKS